MVAPDGRRPDDFTGPVNLGNPVEIPIRQLAEKVLKLVTGKSKLVQARPLPVDDPMQRRPDIALARDKLHWEPKVALGELGPLARPVAPLVSNWTVGVAGPDRQVRIASGVNHARSPQLGGMTALTP